MKDLFSFLNADTDDTWLIKELGWVKPLQGIRESQLALANGFIGSRGILEEIPYDCSPGTYLTGIYDRLTARVSERVNFPNPFNFKLRTNGFILTPFMDADNYSAFEAKDSNEQAFSNLLKILGIKELYIGGLATDYCVRCSVLDALKEGYKVRLLTDAIKGVNIKPDDSKNAVNEMLKKGAKKVTLKEVSKLLGQGL